jgi:hypothetical protein
MGACLLHEACRVRLQISVPNDRQLSRQADLSSPESSDARRQLVDDRYCFRPDDVTVASASGSAPCSLFAPPESWSLHPGRTPAIDAPRTTSETSKP